MTPLPSAELTPPPRWAKIRCRPWPESWMACPALVDSLADDHPVGTPWGEMRLADYLPTRTFELVVHTLDLVGAVGLVSRVPESALSVVLGLFAEAAARSGRAEELLMALAGRAPLPSSLLALGPDS